MVTVQVGFIGGGQMATALASGATQAQVLAEEQLVFADPNPEQRSRLLARFPKAEIKDSSTSVFSQCRKIILAVKPNILPRIAPEISAYLTSDHLLVSIAAGISLEQLSAWFGTQRIVRVMPNTPCQVLEGASAIAASSGADPEDLAWVQALMESVGIAVQISDSLFHAFTGVAGSSPAYAYLMIEALSDGAVAMGLPRETATKMAAQALLGAAKMVLETGLHPATLKDQVTSPGGTTIEALRVLEQGGVRSSVIEAVCRCAERSQELGSKDQD